MSNNPQNLPKPLDGQKLSQLAQAVQGFDQQQLVWASGFLAGLAQAGGAAPEQGENASGTATITVIYGSQTGNAKHAAEDYANKLKTRGLLASAVNMADYKVRKLKDEHFVVIFVSTHGEGDAPDDAVELHEYLASKKAPKLERLNYAVVALGDSSYEFFCQTGKDFDQRLAKLGAKSLLARLDCDVDYAAELAQWTEKLSAEIAKIANVSALATSTSSQTLQALNTAQYTKQAPFTATLSDVIKITGRDSVKDIRHVEISLAGSGIQYKPGDALGVWFSNDPALVEKILCATGNTGDEEVTVNSESISLKQALCDKLELTLSYPGFVKEYQRLTENKSLASLLEDRVALREFLEARQTADIILEFPANVPAQPLVDALRSISPRLYSIASSQSEVEDEVHLTLAHVAYDAFGFQHQGGASGFLSTRLVEGDKLNVYVENNENFRLPDDDKAPVIMVGPGTGIAPFRAFMQERDVREAEGKNWLFFGNPNFTQDFLYQTEWQGYVKSGLLSKISLAFSRDQAQKIYVQDRLLEHGKEVFEWLEQGAHFYVCGDALKMAKDVESALLSIIKQYGNKDDAEAKAYLVAMRKAKRYQKDVY